MSVSQVKDNMDVVNSAHKNMYVDELIHKITQWHHDRNLIDGATDQSQFLKLISEAGELADNVAKGRQIADDIGDMMVVLINIAERNKLSIQDCLSTAYNDIKDRKGRMINGVFVKQADLDKMEKEDAGV